MTTDEDKSHIAKLLQGIEVPDVRLSERCSDLIRDFHEKYDKAVEEEEQQASTLEDVYENPYKADKQLLEENEKKLKELLTDCKRYHIKAISSYKLRVV